jgi:hypothetical protein
MILHRLSIKDHVAWILIEESLIGSSGLDLDIENAVSISAMGLIQILIPITLKCLHETLLNHV